MTSLLPARVADLAGAAPLNAVAEHGAALIAGTAVRSAKAFEAALAALGVAPVPYTEGQSERERVRGLVYTSTAHPASRRVPLHHELSYRAHPPDLVVFLCVRAPSLGGRTPLLDGEAFLRDAPITRRFEGRGICYRKTTHGGFGFGRSWQRHFETEDRDVVERFLAEDGASWRWLDGGGLRVEQIRPAIAPNPRTGALAWHNQATLWHPTNLGVQGPRLRRLLGPERLPTDVCWEDGSPLDDALVNEIREAEYACASRFDWAPGDLLILDNHRVAHGREAFTGDRLVLVAMGPWPARIPGGP